MSAWYPQKTSPYTAPRTIATCASARKRNAIASAACVGRRLRAKSALWRKALNSSSSTVVPDTATTQSGSACSAVPPYPPYADVTL